MTPVSIILGLPSGLTDLCRDICVDLSGRLGRPAQGVEIAARAADAAFGGQAIDCLGSIADALMAMDGEHVIAVLRAPDLAFAASLTRSGRPFLVILDDPRFLALEASVGGDLTVSIRGFSLSGACLLGLIGADGAVILTPRELVAPTSATLREILSCLGFAATDDALATAAQAVAVHVDGSGCGTGRPLRPP